MPLAAYLTGAVGSTFLISAPQAEAAVTSVTFGFGSVLDSSDGVNTSPTTPGLGILLGVGDSYIRVGSPFNPAHGFVYHDLSAGIYSGIPRFFASGTVIGTGSNGGYGAGYFFNDNDSSLSIPTDQLNKNIGFKTGTSNWGWANVSWNATAKALTINSAYVESVPNTPITISVAAVPEPSRALLALAGIGAVALRRRRKQAA